MVEQNPAFSEHQFRGIIMDLSGSPIDTELTESSDTFRRNLDYFQNSVVGCGHYADQLVMIANQQVVVAISKDDYKVVSKQRAFWEEAQKRCEENGTQVADSYIGFVPEDPSQYKQGVEVKVNPISTFDMGIDRLFFQTMVKTQKQYTGQFVLVANGQVIDHAVVETKDQLGIWMWEAQKKCEAVGAMSGFVGFVP